MLAHWQDAATLVTVAAIWTIVVSGIVWVFSRAWN